MMWIAVFGIGYFLGAIPFGVIVGKLWRKDIRQHGSGNVGFTNAWRTLGIGPAILVLIGDFSKGFLASYIGFLLQNETGALLGGMIAIIGHTLSCFIHFKGGKGIATGAGVLFFLSPTVFLICAAILAVLTYLTKYMSVGSITAAVCAPILLWIFKAPTIYIAGIFVMCCYVVYLHRGNIQRLMKGTENKIGKKNNH